MKRKVTLFLAILAVLTLAAGCKDKAPETAAKVDAHDHAAEQTQKAEAKNISGTVVETMDAGGYTYIQVDTGEEKIWAAAPQFKVAVGDPVLVPEGLAMPNHHSKTLNRDFDLVYFVNGVMVAGETAVSAAPAGMGSGMSAAMGQGMPDGHPPIEEAASSEIDFSGIEKAEGGKTVSEVFAEKADLAGKTVSIRAKVVKFSPKIMGKNWIHLQDGTGEAGSNDLTITTAATANVGDIVLVSGVISLDKDFGYGYKYDVIIEDAAVQPQ